MQQTQNYKLNKPEMGDTFSTAPLNENMDTVDAALADHETRVVKLEGCRVLIGTYDGNSQSRDIDLGERPVAVIVCATSAHNPTMGLMVGDLQLSVDSYSNKVYLTDNGFRVKSYLNTTGCSYSFLAFLGGWDTTHIPKP